MARTRYTRQQAERDQAILDKYRPDIMANANKDIVSHLCKRIVELEAEVIGHIRDVAEERNKRDKCWQMYVEDSIDIEEDRALSLFKVINNRLKAWWKK